MFYENRLGIKKIVISFAYVFCPNTGTKFHEPYHSNHVIPHREYLEYNIMGNSTNYILNVCVHKVLAHDLNSKKTSGDVIG